MENIFSYIQNFQASVKAVQLFWDSSEGIALRPNTAKFEDSQHLLLYLIAEYNRFQSMVNRRMCMMVNPEDMLKDFENVTQLEDVVRFILDITDYDEAPHVYMRKEYPDVS